MIKYISDVTGKQYDTLEECTKAEKAALVERDRAKAAQEKKDAERKTRAAEVEDARKAMVAAQKVYRDKIEAFIKDYGHYHYTSSSLDDVPCLFDFFHLL